jgi:23S rRNA pseudouridine1911/1915/1917 synthase
MDPKILFEDDLIFVVDKPSGYITNSSSTTKNQPVLQKWFEKNYMYELSGLEDYRSGIVHRLDKETSGLLIVAKTIKAFENLQAQFKNRQVNKTYIALLHGRLMPEEGVIEAPLGRLPWRRDRFGVIPEGRHSLTNYKVIEFISGERGGYTLTEFYPKTGRTHQIRVHAKHVGHALVADEFYAGRKTARNDRKFCPRLFLHAKSIEFTHPESGELMKINTELPADLSEVLVRLKK